MPRRGPTIATEVLRLVHERGPQELDALATEIVRGGLTRAKDPRRAVLAAIDIKPDFLRDWDGRWCSLADQLEGAMFTHRPASLELRNEVVILPDDLSLVERFVLPGRPFAPGGETHLDFVGEFFGLPDPYHDMGLDRDDDTHGLNDELFDELLTYARESGVPYALDDEAAVSLFLDASRYQQLLHGPPGWLPPLAPGDLLGIRISDGAIETLAVDRREVRGAHVGIVGAQLARLARLVIGPDASWFGPPTIAIEELLQLAATEAPELLRRPLPPVSEVLERGGLEVRHGLVGHPGTDWAAVESIFAPPPQEAWGFRPARIVQ
ncbi:MAG: hypothetical protein ABIZ52_08550 [Candidatus Limnocylindrales bacterium]